MKDYSFKFKLKDKEYNLVFNLNVMQEIQEEYGTLSKWGKLTDATKGEINVKALIFGLTAMLNEGIEIANEENNEHTALFTRKQVGRIITEVGIEESANALNQAIIEGTKNDEKN